MYVQGIYIAFHLLGLKLRAVMYSSLLKPNALRSLQRRALHFAITAALAGLPCSGRAEDETWIARASALWSLDSVWLDGSAPPVGGAPDLVLRFLNVGADTFTATNDLGAPFVLNRLVLGNASTRALTIGSAFGSSLQLAGTAPGIDFSGRGASEVTSDFFLNASKGSTTISGTGLGTLRISGPIREQSPGQVLTSVGLVVGIATMVKLAPMTLKLHEMRRHRSTQVRAC